jgi:hypothetical protein
VKKVQKVQGLFHDAKLADGLRVYNSFLSHNVLKVLNPACAEDCFRIFEAN